MIRTKEGDYINNGADDDATGTTAVLTIAEAMAYGSDNRSLARKGVVAHSISAGSLHSDYHQVSDEIGKIDLPHMTAVIRGIYEAGLEFANREERPAYNEMGERRLRLGRRARKKKAQTPAPRPRPESKRNK